MTALEFAPPDLPWSQNGYLLFNAVRTENLLPRLYQWNPGIDCYPLFIGTRFKALLDVSPVIVAIEGPQDPVLQAFLENAKKIWGLLLFSHADLKTLFEHLRWLVSVDEPVGKATLLNLSDPPVANALFDLYPLQTDNRLFGPIEHVYAVDRFEQRWRHHQRMGEPAINNHEVLYRLSEAQIEALDESGFRNVVIGLMIAPATLIGSVGTSWDNWRKWQIAFLTGTGGEKAGALSAVTGDLGNTALNFHITRKAFIERLGILEDVRAALQADRKLVSSMAWATR